MNDARFFGDVGYLFPYDVRFDPSDTACLSLTGDGQVAVSVTTEPGLQEATVVLQDGTGVPLTRTGGTGRFVFWEATFPPPGRTFGFSLAFRDAAGHAVYVTPAGVAVAIERLDRWQVDVDELRLLAVPDWARGAVIYQIFPDRFANGNPANDPPGTVPWGSPPHPREFQGGDLDGVADHVDWLVDLGVDVVYLNPVFTSPSNHRYDTVDYYTVDPAVGGNDALARLVDVLHRHGIRLILDASFNHCHPRFFAFADVVAHGADSRYRDWFVVDEFPVRVRYRPDVIRRRFRHPDDYLASLADFEAHTGIPAEPVGGDGPAVEPTYEAWYQVPTMPRIDLAHPEARRYFLDVAAFWLREFDIDGWRMDVTRYVDDDFWVDFRQAAKAAEPEALLLAEVMGDARLWLQGDRFDGTMQYQFRQLCIDWFAAGGDTDRFVDGLTRLWHTYPRAASEVSQMLLSSHDTARFRTVARGDADRLRDATFFQLTAPGAPGLYYGDEVGMEGSDDVDARRAFPWDGPWDEQQLATVRELSALRRRHRALRTGGFEMSWHDTDAFLFRRHDDADAVLVAVNRSPDPVTIPVSGEVLWGNATPTRDGLVVSRPGAVVRG